MELDNATRLKKRRTLVSNSLERHLDDGFSKTYPEVLLSIAERFDDPEMSDFVLEQFIEGLFESKIENIYSSRIGIDVNDQSVIAVCAVHNSESLVRPYVEHYRSIGVNNFVFIDNDSSDNTVGLIVANAKESVAVDIWQTVDRFDGFKAMGWKQRMFNHYGLDRWYLNLDIDEHFVYQDCENKEITEVIKDARKIGATAVGALLLDMYPDADITDTSVLGETFTLSELRDEYAYFDTNTYRYVQSEDCPGRIFGGPRTRMFDRHPSLQKYPLSYVDTQAIAINPHFWYPYSHNSESQFESALLHYKFLPGDIEKYREYVKSGVHWDGSSQYRSYVDGVDELGSLNFYDSCVSSRYSDSSSLQHVTLRA